MSTVLSAKSSKRPPSPRGDGGRPRVRIHWAWVVAAASLLVLIGSSGFRALPGVVMDPMRAQQGWSHTSISLAVSANLVLFGLTAPFSAALMERWGIRRVVTGALLLLSLGSALPVFLTTSLQLIIGWGLLAGIGGGAVALAYVATLTNRWFVKHRGLVIGVLTAGGTAGQLVFLPLLAWLAGHYGWRTASLIAAGAALAAVPLAFWLVRDHPRDLGVEPYGADQFPEQQVDAATADGPRAARPAGAIRILADASRTKAFWLLAGGFGICGVTTVGAIQTHFIPAAHDHGMAVTTAASLLALAGVFDVAGTTLSGWLTDRIDSRVLLAVYYTLRGLSLLFLPSLFAAHPTPPMLAFAIFYGLDWIATVPPTIRLCQECFGQAGGVVFGWMWTAHQLGGAAAAAVGGYIRDQMGVYTMGWYGAGLVCVTAAFLSIRIPRGRARPAPPPEAAGTAPAGLAVEPAGAPAMDPAAAPAVEPAAAPAVEPAEDRSGPRSPVRSWAMRTLATPAREYRNGFLTGMAVGMVVAMLLMAVALLSGVDAHSGHAAHEESASAHRHSAAAAAEQGGRPVAPREADGRPGLATLTQPPRVGQLTPRGPDARPIAAASGATPTG